MKKIISLILVLVSVLFLIGCTTEQVEISSNDESDVQVQEEAEQVEDNLEGDVKTFIVTGDNFNFYIDGVKAPEIRVNVGDRVRIEFESIGGFHDWVVDEFDAATEKVQTGGTTSVEFVASEAGTFEYDCSVGSHRANGMVGNLIVE